MHDGIGCTGLLVQLCTAHLVLECLKVTPVWDCDLTSGNGNSVPSFLPISNSDGLERVLFCRSAEQSNGHLISLVKLSPF